MKTNPAQAGFVVFKAQLFILYLSQKAMPLQD